MAQFKGVCVGAGYFSHFQYEAWQRIPEVTITAVRHRPSLHRLSRDAREGKARLRRYHHTAADAPGDVPNCRRDGHSRDLPETAGADARRGQTDRGLYERGGRALHGARELAVPALVSRDQATARRRRGGREDSRNELSLAHGRRLGRRGLPEPPAVLQGLPAPARLRERRALHRHLPLPRSYRYLGDEIRRVYAVLKKLNPVIAGEDFGVVVFHFESGATGLWDANRYNESNTPNPRYTFGEFLVDADGGSIRLYNDGRLPEAGRARRRPRVPTRRPELLQRLLLHDPASLHRPHAGRQALRDRRG